MMVDRPCYAVGLSNPGSDLAAEVAASLAATAIVWMKTESGYKIYFVLRLSVTLIASFLNRLIQNLLKNTAI